jgi:predicted ATPase/DNA-binding winged helix-turn-helix (wHTH) protein
MIQVGRFEVDPARHTLNCGAERVKIGTRAFDILMLLAASRGRLVTKDELIKHVWPDTIVEENNLQVHLSALRKVLGEDRHLIVTLTGRGYQLAGCPEESEPQTKAIGEAVSPCMSEVVQQHPEELFGREPAIREIDELLQKARAVTLVGAGGIGKTSLATAVARHIARRFSDGVYYASLASHADASAALVAVADACGLVFAGGAVSAHRISAALVNKQCLLILDNAEHIIDVVAHITDVLTSRSAALRVLTTSREPLRLAVESVYRVQPLDVPEKDAQCQDVLARSAVRLFLHRARMLQPHIADDVKSVSLVGEVCRRLDGIPLAIELAAARAATLGIDGLHSRLNDRLKVLAGGLRTALPRHQTLRATFDWSYALLDPVARTVFRRLSQFAGSFLIDDACAVAVDDATTPMAVITSVGELAEKSWLALEFEGVLIRYRLPESTRAYARAKLDDEGEAQGVAAAHARWLQKRFGREMLASDLGTRETSEYLRDALDDARSALDWAFSVEGDKLLGVKLTGVLVEALLAWSLIEECCARAGRAVAALEKLPAGSVDAPCELRLRAALAAALLYTRGPVSEATQLSLQVLSLATEERDGEFQTRALWGLFNAMLFGGRIRASLKYATLLQTLADERGEEFQGILANQMVGVSLSWLGEHTKARALMERGLERINESEQKQGNSVGFRVNTLAVAKSALARILWVQGYTDEALSLIDVAVNLVRTSMQEPSLSRVLGGSAVSIALLSGDFPTASRYLDMLRAQATQHRLEIWLDCCDCLSGQFDILNGRIEPGIEVMEAALAALQARGFNRFQSSMAGVWAEGLAHVGRTGEARRVLAETLSYCSANGNHLFAADTWRIFGVIALVEARRAATTGSSHAAHEAEAQASFLRAIEIARRQSARMWELRAVIPLAQLWHSQRRTHEAMQMLGPLCSWFPTASASRDVCTARALLSELRDADVACSTQELNSYSAEHNDPVACVTSFPQYGCVTP